ncbi:MAG TPA: hypothetical protein VFS43_22570 [Polyangiaceae bacterium]|nr:hypothetical protein [Polyangiaceae bacterium]
MIRSKPPARFPGLAALVAGLALCACESPPAAPAAKGAAVSAGLSASAASPPVASPPVASPPVASAPCASAAPLGPRPPASPADVASIDAIVAALYDTISGPAGKRRDWDRLRSLFVPGGRLVPAVERPSGGAEVRLLDVEDYVRRAGSRIEAEGFFEREVSRKIEAFGNVAHVFSTYESRRAAGDEKPFDRGINSIQLLKDGARWWVVSVYWDSERPNNPLPEKYLPAR